MSRSFRTEKESVAAARQVRRTAEGDPVLPRIIERAPAPGEVHPLPARVLRRVLQRTPVEYIHGLSRIELRARHLPDIGRPYGCYWSPRKE